MPPTSTPGIPKTEVCPQNNAPAMSSNTSAAKLNGDNSVNLCDDSDKCLNTSEHTNNMEPNLNCESKDLNNMVDKNGKKTINKFGKDILEKSISEIKSSVLKNSLLSSANLSTQIRDKVKDTVNNSLQNGEANICDNGDIDKTISSKPLLKEQTKEDLDAYNITGGTINNIDPECFFCGLQNSEEVELKPCQYCKDVYYCGQTHYEYHRPESTCYPFIIKHAPGFGR